MEAEAPAEEVPTLPTTAYAHVDPVPPSIPAFTARRQVGLNIIVTGTYLGDTEIK